MENDAGREVGVTLYRSVDDQGASRIYARRYVTGQGRDVEQPAWEITGNSLLSRSDIVTK